MSECDLISIHLTLSQKSKGIFSAQLFSQMKKGSWLINTSRGNLVDETALLQSLKNEHLRGAAFDVFGNEPPSDIELLNHPNFICTPHIGGSTAQSILAMGRSAIQNLSALKPIEAFTEFF